MTLVIGQDPGSRSGGLCALRFVGHRPTYIASNPWSTKLEDLSEILGSLSMWIDDFRLMSLRRDEAIDLFCVEDQRWSRLPHSGVSGRSNASDISTVMAQAVGMAWGSLHAGRVVLVQPMAARRVAIGKASKFSATKVRLPKNVVEKARREHAKKVDAAIERALCGMVSGMPAGLTDHEYAAATVAIAGRQAAAKAGAV